MSKSEPVVRVRLLISHVPGPGTGSTCRASGGGHVTPHRGTCSLCSALAGQPGWGNSLPLSQGLPQASPNCPFSLCRQWEWGHTTHSDCPQTPPGAPTPRCRGQEIG